MPKIQTELTIVQRTYDLILWYVPILNRLPRDHRFALGDRIVSNLYELLEGLILARYARERGRSLSLSTADWMSCATNRDCCEIFNWSSPSATTTRRS